MWPLRISASVALALLGGYAVLRTIATQCAGVQCDVYVMPSLALPIAAVVAVGVTGVLAIYRARPLGGSWPVILIASTLLGVIGPPVALAVFRDQPDSLVVVASLLLVQAPVAALVFSVHQAPKAASRLP